MARRTRRNPSRKIIAAEDNNFAYLKYKKMDCVGTDFAPVYGQFAGAKRAYEVKVPLDVVMLDGTEKKALFIFAIHDVDEEGLGMTWQVIANKNDVHDTSEPEPTKAEILAYMRKMEAEERKRSR